MKTIASVLVVLISVVLSGCEYENGDTDNGLIIGDGGQQQVSTRRPPPTLRGVPEEDGGATKTVTEKERDGTVTFANTEVIVSPVGLELAEAGVRVVTNLPPTEGTLFVLLRVSYWARAADTVPFMTDNITVTIHKHAESSRFFWPNLWPGVTTEVSVEPLERLQEMAQPFATAELHVVGPEHKFVPYEPMEAHKQLVFPPE